MQTLKMVPTRVRVTSILKRAIYSGEYKSGQELSLTAIAEKLGISRTPVREAFQTLAAEGLITLRMSHAQRLLVHEPGLSVKQIGEMCGYHDQGYFSRIFKKHTGKSPLEFRG